MKRLLIAFCLLVLPIFFCADALAIAAPIPSKIATNVIFAKYENATYNIQINYPTHWEISEGFMGSIVVFSSPPDSPTDQFSENANVVVENITSRPALTLDRYFEEGSKILATMITDFKPINVENRVISGTPAKVLVFTGKQGVYRLKFMQASIIANNKGYVVTFAAEEAQYKNYEEIGTKILNSMLIKNEVGKDSII